MDTTAIDWTQTGIIAVLILTAFVTGTGKRRAWIFHWVHVEILNGYKAMIDVLGKQLAEKTTEADEWKRIALTQAGIFERSVETVERVITRTLTSDEAVARRGEVPGERDA